MDKQEKKIEVPLYMINPIYSILKLEWVIATVKDLLKNKKEINIFLIKNSDYLTERHKKGSFGALVKHNYFVEIAKDCCKDEKTTIIGEFNKSTLIVISTMDLSLNLTESYSSEEVSFKIGATKSSEEDNVFGLIQKAELALNYAQQNKVLTHIL